MKRIIFSMSALVCIASQSFAVPTDPKKDHDKANPDSKRTATQDLAPEYTPAIKELKVLEKDGGRITVDRSKISLSAFFAPEKKDLKPEEFADIRKLVEEMKAASEKLKSCNGDEHAAALDKLLSRCGLGEVAQTFLKSEEKDGKVEWSRRAGVGNDTFKASEREFAQCQRSMDAVFAERKKHLKDTAADKDLSDRFGKLMKLFEFDQKKLDASFLAHFESDEQKEIKALEEEAMKGVTAKSCVITKKPASSSNANSNVNELLGSGEEAGSDAADSEKKKAEEETDEKPNNLVPTYRGGPTAVAGKGDGPREAVPSPVPPPQAPVPVSPTPGIGAPIDPSALNPFNNAFPFDPGQLLDALQRPDGARVGGTNSRGAPSFQAPSVSPPGGGGGNDKGPEQPQDNQQQQPQPPPFMPPQQQPLIIGDNNNGLAPKETPKEEKATPRPDKEDVNAAGKAGFDKGYAAAMAALQGGQMGGPQQARGSTTGQKLTAAGARGRFARGNGMNSRGRSNAARGRYQVSSFNGTGSNFNTVNRSGQSLRSPQSGNIGRGSPGIP